MTKPTNTSFQNLIRSELISLNEQNKSIYPEKDLFKIDLHCHDMNSNVPDEILGRILNVSETWIQTNKLISTLEKHGMDAFTITNHNNARSCYDMLDKGFDILTGAEFSCLVPDYQTGIHVLTYGFTPAQETSLNKLRKNIYSFLDYTNANNLPTIWAHPLYHYKKSGPLSPDFFNKMALLFERFEVINGQRDTWQNMLVKKWIDTLTIERLEELSKMTGIEPGKYCREPYKKSMAGGSDSHMGIFGGLTGTQLYVPDLEERRKSSKMSELALEAIREGRMIAFGGHNNSEKMMVAFLDYVCQIAIKGEDPGLVRILLHNGDTKLKFTALLVANSFAELRKHKVTMSFINLFHESLTGIEPHFTRRWFVPKVYKPIFDEAKIMAKTLKSKPGSVVETYSESIYKIYNMLGNILDERLSEKIENFKRGQKSKEPDLNLIISNLELPSELRSYLEKNKKTGISGKELPDIAGFLDGLSFPFLASAIILSAHFTSTRVLYNSRPLLNDFSKALGTLEHPKKMLWITDIWNETKGIPLMLRSILDEIKRKDLKIDIMICSTKLRSADNLIIVKPQSELKVPGYKDQRIRIPNYLEIHNKFLDGEYDRIMCSTEGPMGLAALYLKNAYSVPAYYYMRTDWKVFPRKILKLEKENQNRFFRLLRAYYRAFDGIFVLNSDHFNWLIDKKMGINKSKVFLTAHWPAQHFFPRPSAKKLLFRIKNDNPVIVYAGRLNNERGIMELPAILKAVRSVFPETAMVIAGSGPGEEQLKKALPEAIYLGWVDSAELPTIYSSADLLVLPSKSDTFSSVVLESLACGLPVIAMNTKSPADIIQNEVNGYLVTTTEGMIHQIISYLKNPECWEKMKKEAVRKSKEYTAEKIIKKLMQDTGLIEMT